MLQASREVSDETIKPASINYLLLFFDIVCAGYGCGLWTSECSKGKVWGGGHRYRRYTELDREHAPALVSQAISRR